MDKRIIMSKQGGRNRADDIEIQKRIFAIAKLILEGYVKRAFLLQKISEFDWGVTERQIDNYIKSAKELISNQFDENDLSLEKDIALNRLESIFTMNMKIQDYREARNTIMDKMKLLGLLTHNIDHTSKGEKVQAPVTIQIDSKDIELK